MSDYLAKSVNFLSTEEADIRFQVPCSICVSGPSQSGKSHWILRLIQNRNVLFTSDFQQLIYCIPENLSLNPNPIFEQIKKSFQNAQIHIGLPDVAKLSLNFDNSPKLLVVDDLMSEFLNSYQMVHLLSIEVHHCNITTIFTLHNLFAPSKFGRTITRNINYKILFCNRLDIKEIRNISLQISNQPNFLNECFTFLYKEFTNEPPYLVIDGHIKSKQKHFFVRSQIFPSKVDSEIRPIIFSPKN